MPTNSHTALTAIRQIQDWLGYGAAWPDDDCVGSMPRFRRAYLGAKPYGELLVEVAADSCTSGGRVAWHLQHETVVHGLSDLAGIPRYLEELGDCFRQRVPPQTPMLPDPARNFALPGEIAELVERILKLAPRWKHWVEPFGGDQHAVYFGRPPSFGSPRIQAWLVFDAAGAVASIGEVLGGQSLTHTRPTVESMSAWVKGVEMTHRAMEQAANEAPQSAPTPSTLTTHPRTMSHDASTTPAPHTAAALAPSPLRAHERSAVAKFARASSERFLLVRFDSRNDAEHLLDEAVQAYRRTRYLESAQIAEVLVLGKGGSLRQAAAREAFAMMQCEKQGPPDLLVVFDLEDLFATQSGSRPFVLSAMMQGMKLAAGINHIHTVAALTREVVAKSETSRGQLLTRDLRGLARARCNHEWRCTVVNGKRH
ncbi:hypothetical protein OPU71_17015 [Niveibacterium sp. 24ML]|uniref:hypothetical protein n=1 Tax=Niveibacterium sp. 24ML TaxID=2985512 RepID=UPI00227040FC|nr:hypothetical protein [Niveibacterium sp. 24ML]MCX9157827.1 hypothetical protein [Niveibacterium sp. 24ML]